MAALAVAPRAIVLSNGHAGAQKQAEALAQAMRLSYSVLTVSGTRLLDRLPPQLRVYVDALIPAGMRTDVIRPPYPDVVIASGRTTISAAAAVRQASGGRTFVIQVQHPYVPHSLFSAIVCPEHDFPLGSPPPDANVLLTCGALCAVSPESLARAADRWRHLPPFAAFPRPLTAVLVGGRTRRFPFDAAFARALAARLATAPGSLLVTLSRRTPPEAKDELRSALGPLVGAGRAWIYDPSPAPGARWTPAALEPPDGDSNPYDGLLALADRVVVTADSVSMASEAASAGRPLYVAGAASCAGKLARFHAALAGRRLARPLEAMEGAPGGPWGGGLAEAARVGGELRGRLAEHGRRWGAPYAAAEGAGGGPRSPPGS